MENDEVITKLYANMIVQNATLKMIIGLLVGYVETVDKVKAKALGDYIKNNFASLVDEEFMSSPFAETYLSEVTQNFLQSIPGVKGDITP